MEVNPKSARTPAPTSHWPPVSEKSFNRRRRKTKGRLSDDPKRNETKPRNQRRRALSADERRWLKGNDFQSHRSPQALSAGARTRPGFEVRLISELQQEPLRFWCKGGARLRPTAGMPFSLPMTSSSKYPLYFTIIEGEWNQKMTGTHRPVSFPPHSGFTIST